MMEKVVLNAMLHGADKIPDRYFEAIPGHFYKPREGESPRKMNGGQDRDSRDRRSRDRRRHSDSDDDYDDRRRSARDDRYDNDYDEINNRPRRPRSRATRDGYDEYDDRPRRSYDGYDRPRDQYSRQPDHSNTIYDRPSPPNGAALGAGAGAGLGAAAAANNSNGSTSSYVPYSNIYGQAPHESAREGGQPYSPAPPSVAGSIQPNAMNQVSAHPIAPQSSYHQNPYAQEAPLGAQPGYYLDPHAHHYDDNYGDRSGWRESTDDRYDQDLRHRRRRSDSYSDDGGDRRADSRRRARSSRRRDDGGAGSDVIPRAKSKAKEMFDTDKRSLGYSTVGALAGGLAGNELGGGLLPTVLGAAVGALGVNAFQAREKKKNAERDGLYDRERPVSRDRPVRRSRSRRRRDDDDYSD